MAFKIIGFSRYLSLQRASTRCLLLSTLIVSLWLLHRVSSEKLVPTVVFSQQFSNKLKVSPSVQASPSVQKVSPSDHTNRLKVPSSDLIDTETTNITKSENCTLYFSNLYKTSPNWKTYYFGSNEFEDNADFYSDDKYAELKKNFYTNVDFKQRLLNEYDNYGQLNDQELSLLVENKITEFVSHLKIFSSCFIDPDFSLKLDDQNEHKLTLISDSDEYKKSIIKSNLNLKDIEKRLLPWFSGILPQFRSWDGEIVDGNVNLNKVEKNEREFYPILDSFRKTFSGKGIVLSVADKYTDEIIKFIGMLRILDNELPIQLFHRKELSAENQKKIIESARSPFNYELFLEYNKHIDIKDIKSKKFPAQNVWFVDLTNSISKDYNTFFSGYANKILPMIFSNLADTILMDIDTILMVPPKFFFNLPTYKSTGSVFYKDREIDVKASEASMTFLKSLLPSSDDFNNFNIPYASNNTFNERFFKDNQRHLQEAGVVVMKRSDVHYRGLIMGAQLILWPSLRARMWGEKELYWLGQSVMGQDKLYHFNRLPAGVIGAEAEISEDSIRMCTIHPAHVSDTDNSTLLWFNSGWKVCETSKGGGVNIENELQNTGFRDKFANGSDLEIFYNSKINVSSVYIPPANAWAMGDYCNGFVWCASGPKDIKRGGGLYLEYNSDLLNKADIYEAVWRSAENITK